MKVLNAIFVREFYLAHAGFFLFVVAIAGGFMRSYEHLALAEFFISTPTVMTIPILVWIHYAIKVINFNDETLSLDENGFLSCFVFLPSGEKWTLAIRVAALQLLPVFLYGSFLCVVAGKYQLFLPILMACLSCGLLLWATSFRLIHGLSYSRHEKKISFVSRMLNTRMTKPFPLFFIEWVVRNDFVALIGTKIFTMLAIFGITKLYATDSYDIRLISLGIIISSSANAMLIHALHRFENFHTPFLKGLPLSFFKRLVYTLMTMITLMLPEVIVLTRSFPTGLTWTEYVGTFTLMLSIPILFYGGLFTRDRNQQEMMNIVFALAIAWFVAVLFKIPAGLIAAVDIAFGVYLWQKFYYSFEYISKESSTN
jgi:hypothetical protein